VLERVPVELADVNDFQRQIASFHASPARPWQLPRRRRFVRRFPGLRVRERGGEYSAKFPDQSVRFKVVVSRSPKSRLHVQEQPTQ
jgi:hypothetical protein